MTDFTPALQEGRRQRYLAALGIPLWSSRHDLPGAQASAGLAFVPWQLETETAAPLPAPSATIVAKAPPHPVVRDAAAQAPEPAPAQRPAVQAEATSASTRAVATEPLRFACYVQTLLPGLVAVIALDEVPDLSAQEYRLLENLTQALGGDGVSAADREHFRWPLSPNPSIPRDAAAAREALAAFLGRRVRPAENLRWLVLGETLAVYVRTALPQQTVMAAPGLRELLQEPAKKRGLWQVLHG